MENKLKMELEALPAPQTTFEDLEALAKRPQPVRRRKGVFILAAAMLALLLCGMGWAKTQYGMWHLGGSWAWEDLESVTEKYEIQLPQKLDGIPFLQYNFYGHVPQGASHAEALLNPRYKSYAVEYGYVLRENDANGIAIAKETQTVLDVSFGTTENELWRYYFQFDENGIWTACQVPESYQVVEYKGITLQIGDTYFYDSVKNCTRYTRWVHWVDEEKQMVFSVNDTDYTDPDRVVECAKQIIDLNS